MCLYLLGQRYPHQKVKTLSFRQLFAEVLQISLQTEVKCVFLGVKVTGYLPQTIF